MEIQIPLIPTSAPLPLDADALIEVAVPDIASATGFTTCKVKPSALFGTSVKSYEANYKQSGTSAPTVTELLNNTGVIPTISRTAPGVYKLTFLGLFPDSNKLSLHPFINGEDGRNAMIPVHSGAAIAGFYSLYYSDIDSLILICYNLAHVPQEMHTLLGGTATNLPIKFTVYP